MRAFEALGILMTEAGLDEGHEDVASAKRLAEEFRASAMPKVMVGHLILQHAGLASQEGPQCWRAPATGWA